MGSILCIEDARRALNEARALRREHASETTVQRSYAERRLGCRVPRDGMTCEDLCRFANRQLVRLRKARS
jgi:hypothetical protein